MQKASGVLCAAALLLTACEQLAPITGVDLSDYRIRELDYARRTQYVPDSPDDLRYWSKAVGVHNPGGIAYDVQMAALRKLHAAGQLEWVRLGATMVILEDPRAGWYHRDAKAMGLNIVNVVQLYDLEKYGWEKTFDELYARYPHDDNDVWGIAGEVTNDNPSVNPQGTVTSEYYLAKFRSLYYYVKYKYPKAILSNGPTFGSGGGPRELQWYFDPCPDIEDDNPLKKTLPQCQGFLDLDIVISINVYSDHAVTQYGALFQGERYHDRIYGNKEKNIPRRRVFITETGEGWGRQYHLGFAREFFRRIHVQLNAERMFWYVNWGGDPCQSPGDQTDNGFGLISGVECGEYVEGPLFWALTHPFGTPYPTEWEDK